MPGVRDVHVDVSRLVLHGDREMVAHVGAELVRCDAVPDDLRVEMPVETDAEQAPVAYVQGANDGGAHSLWPALYPELLELVR